MITFYLGPNAAGNATLEITSPDGRTRSLPIPAGPGSRATPGTAAWKPLAAGGGGEAAAAAPAAAAGAAPAGEEGGAVFFRRRPRRTPPRLAPGAYSLKLTLGSDVATGTLQVRQDPILDR